MSTYVLLSRLEIQHLGLVVVYIDVHKDGRIIGIEFLDPDYLIQFIRERGDVLDLDQPVDRDTLVSSPSLRLPIDRSFPRTLPSLDQ